MDEAKKPAAKRKPHRKSRTGCKQCRVSRVKCDETKPSCSYCTRHSVRCSFLSMEPTLPSNTSVIVTGRAENPARRHSGGTIGGGSPHPNGNSSALCNNLHMGDLELFLHYNTSTALTITSQNPADTAIWTACVPQIALSHLFLMHGVLGISALHLSRLNPDRHQEYAILAAEHKDIAFPLFRAEAVKITERNCAAVFAFATLVSMYTIASTNQTGFFLSLDSDSDGLPEWLHLLRGVDAIISPRRDLVLQSPLAPLVDIERDQNRVLSPPDELALNILSTLYAIPSNSTPARAAELEVYRETVSLLRDSFTNPNPFEPSQPLPYIWFTLVSESYLQFLSQMRAEALVLLAYECVILKRLEPCWFVDGVADHIMRTVMETLTLEWRVWIEWPLQEMGLRYDYLMIS